MCFWKIIFDWPVFTLKLNLTIHLRMGPFNNNHTNETKLHWNLPLVPSAKWSIWNYPFLFLQNAQGQSLSKSANNKCDCLWYDVLSHPVQKIVTKGSQVNRDNESMKQNAPYCQKGRLSLLIVYSVNPHNSNSILYILFLSTKTLTVSMHHIIYHRDRSRKYKMVVEYR